MKADPTTAKFLPYSRQSIDEDDIAAVVAALRSDFLTTGPLVDQFESAFAEAAGAENLIVCNSGTSALHLAMLALKVGPGDHVIVPAVTFLSTANVARMAGAEVIFADVDPDTGLMTPETFEAAITTAHRGQHVAAALPVHLGGQLCDMAALSEIAARHGISLVEDACHALGVPGIGATQHSAMACFSTHPVKAIATGEGGAVATSNSDLAMRLRQLRSHGMSRNPDDWAYPEQGLDQGIPNPWYYEMTEIGWNYRLPDVLCALGLSQLKKLDRFITRRQEIAARYDALLTPLAPAITPVPRGTGPHGWHLYAILVDFDALNTTRGAFMRGLAEAGIGSQVHYIPLHFQPYYRERYGRLSLPGAEAYYRRTLSIPFFPDMTESDTDRVAATLTQLVHGKL